MNVDNRRLGTITTDNKMKSCKLTYLYKKKRFSNVSTVNQGRWGHIKYHSAQSVHVEAEGVFKETHQSLAPHVSQQTTRSH